MTATTPPSASSRATLFLAGLLFFLSGAASLAYEVAWVKVLTLQFGSAAWSIAAVVASFMAGLGAGGAWAGRRADGVARPLRAYGLIEFGIALYGAISVPLLANMNVLVDPLYGFIDSSFTLFLLLQFLLSALVLATPTFLMGASLPLLVVAVSRAGTFRRSVALFYGINTLGAAAGTLAAGLVLLPALGIANSVWVAVAVGVLVAAGALALDRRVAPGAAAALRQGQATRIPRLLLAAMALAGCFGLFYQIAWTRLLIPVVGSSAYAFTIILATVLIGIGVGALLAAVPSFRESSCWRAVAVAIGLGSCSALAGLFAVNELPGLFTAMARQTGDRTWLLFAAQGLLAAAIVFVPACSMGAALPLGIAAWRNETGAEGRAVGSIYAANTAGAIVGSALGGFVLLPWIGATGLVQLGAALGMALALALLLLDLSRPLRQRLLWAGVGAAALVAFAVALPQTDIAQLQRGVFRRIQAGDNAQPNGSALLYAEEGTNATVTVFRNPNSTVLKINGKADASTGPDMETQYLVGHLPMFLHPEPRRVCILGYGSGATVYAVATHPGAEVVDVLEIEQRVIEASRYFDSVNHDVLADPRVTLYTEDGRNFLHHRDATYDLVVSQPSNPWIAGISSLFTSEYYRAAQARRNPGGLCCQWIQAYEISAETTRAMLNTLAAEFAHVVVFSAEADLVCIASQSPIGGTAARYAERFAVPAVRTSLERVRISSIYDLFAGAYVSHPENAAPFASPVKNTDDNLWLEYRAPIEMYRGVREAAVPVALDDYLPLVKSLFSDLTPRDAALAAARSIATRYPDRWHLIPDLASALAADRPLAAQLAQLAAAAEARHRDLQANEQREQTTRHLVGARRYAEAIPLFEAILAVQPANGGAHRMLAWSLSQTGQTRRALQHYGQAVERNPDDFEAYANMAALALSRGAPEGMQLLDRSLEANPHHFTAWHLYVQYLSNQRQYDRARQQVRRAAEWLDGAQVQALASIIPR